MEWRSSSLETENSVNCGGVDGLLKAGNDDLADVDGTSYVRFTKSDTADLSPVSVSHEYCCPAVEPYSGGDRTSGGLHNVTSGVHNAGRSHGVNGGVHNSIGSHNVNGGVHNSGGSHNVISDVHNSGRSNNVNGGVYNSGGSHMVPPHSRVPLNIPRVAGVQRRRRRLVQCIYCCEPFDPTFGKGRRKCRDAPDRAMDWIKIASCVCVADTVAYHCFSDSEGDFEPVCVCTRPSLRSVLKWTAIILTSIFLPCLCCYWPLVGCRRCAMHCGYCVPQHRAA